MEIEKGTLYKIDCGKEIPTSEFADNLLLLINQKSSNSQSGIMDVETEYGTNHLWVTVRDSVCEYKMEKYLRTFGEVTAEPITLLLPYDEELKDLIRENKVAIDNTECVDKTDEAYVSSAIKKIKSEEYVNTKGFVLGMF